MNDYIAYCGLDCETCEARLATVRNDDELRKKVSKEWSELNGVEITPEMINCSGCRIPGPKTVYCDSLCPIRQCAGEKQVETCGACPEMKSCKKVGAIIGNNPDARERLIAACPAQMSSGKTAAGRICPDTRAADPLEIDLSTVRDHENNITEK